jgi:Tfp pilus assembly protein PilW
MMHSFLHTRKRQHGFSLVEMLVYVAVVVFVAGALISTFLSLNTVLLRNRTERELAESARASLERIERDIRNADSINTALSTLGSNPGVLVLTGTGTTTKFYVSSSTLMLNVNGVDLGPLTSDAVTVRSIVFNRYVGTTTDLVRVTLTLSAVSKAASTTRTFYTSAVVRGTYD